MLLFGLLVSCTLFAWDYRQEQYNEHVNFERRAQARVAVVRQGMTDTIDALQVVNQLFVTHGSISREQFRLFTQPLLARYPQIEAFSFHQRVSRHEHPESEARMRSSFPGFRITGMVDGRQTIAAEKGRYSAINYIEPMAGNEAAFDLDTSSSSVLDDPVRRAEDTGLPSASGLLQVFNNSTAQRSFRILMAVYRSGAALDDVAARRLAVVGYTGTLLRTNTLFEKILDSDPAANQGLDIRVYASELPEESKLVYGQASAAAEHHARWFQQAPQPISRNFEVAGTPWRMDISARASSFSAMHARGLFSLTMGLLATFAASAYLLASAMRTRRIEHLVAQRTDELKQVNYILGEDIRSRALLEQALLHSEERAREFAELSSDLFWEQDEHFRYTTVSDELTGNEAVLPPFMHGVTRWEVPVDPDASDWTAHRALLEAHLPFKNFEFKTISIVPADGSTLIRWFSSSGKPLFDADGHFKGYRGASSNISERKQAEAALGHSRKVLRSLADHQEGVREDERKRIARDIHDELGQNLLAHRLDMSLMATQFDTNGISKERILAALAQIDTTIKAVRSIINDLRPAVLDLGLHAAVEWQVQEFERRSAIACELHIDHEEFVIDDRNATALFRILQESLSNILRHAQASHVLIGMQRRDGGLFLKVADDGVGLPAKWRHKAKSFGLVGIEERIYALGGTFSIASNPGQGMTVMVSIPLAS